MMGLHAVQAVMEEAYSVEDVLALVQHDALGADAPDDCNAAFEGLPCEPDAWSKVIQIPVIESIETMTGTLYAFPRNKSRDAVLLISQRTEIRSAAL